MSQSVTMPALGESVTEGTVTRWLKSEGDSVEVDEPLLEISTDKVDTEVPSPVAGVITKILVAEDDTVEVGAELCVVGDGSEDAGSDDDGEAAEDESASEEAPSEPEAAEEPAQEDEPAAASAESPASSGGSGEQHAITLPALGESVTEGTITRWLKSEGDSVEVDEPLLEISTDKVDTEVPSPVAGVITKILVAEDDTVEVGAELAHIGDGSASADDSGSADAAPAEEPKREPAPAEEPAEEPKSEQPKSEQAEPSEPAATETPAQSSGSGNATYVTPLVRKLANEKGVDLASVEGTGVGGRIRRQDVLEAADRAAKEAEKAKQAEKPAAAASPSPSKPSVPDVSPLRGTTEKMSRLRKIISARMVESLQVSAQLTTVVEVDVTKIAALRNKVKNDFAAREGTKLTFLPFFVKAATEALKAHPKLNAQIEGDEIVYHGQENVGIAVDTERGLLVPVIKDAGDLNLAGVAKKINDLAARTRDNKVTPDELGGGTFTITNTGSGGALFDTPIINQPQVAILGVGTIQRRPAVVKDAEGNETIGIRSLVYLAISYDHRLVDGADAARYLQTVKKRLEEGAFEGELGL